MIIINLLVFEKRSIEYYWWKFLFIKSISKV